MGLVAQIAVYTVLFGFLGVAWIVSCGDPNKSDLLGRLSWWLQFAVPPRLWAVVDALRLRGVVVLLQRLCRFCVFGRNPIVQIGYLVITLGGFGVFIYKGYPLIPNVFLAGYHRWIGLFFMVLCMVTFYLACFTDPGIVRADTVRFYNNYAFDGLLYARKECPTCHVLKVARSKHCRVCDVCISRFDHYCIWLNNAVGERNYRWFLAFLLVHAIILLYGTAATLSIFGTEIVSKRLFEQTFVHKVTGERTPASWGIVFQFLLFHHSELMCILLLCGVMGLVVTGFFLYHLYLAARNVTTNETFKYAEAQREYQRALQHHEIRTTAYQLAQTRLSALLREQDRAEERQGAGAAGGGIGEGGGEEEGEVESVLGPAEPAGAASSATKPPTRKEQIETLRAVPEPGPPPREPKNVWDNGVYRNFYDILFPPSDRARKGLPSRWDGRDPVAEMEGSDSDDLCEEHRPAATARTSRVGAAAADSSSSTSKSLKSSKTKSTSSSEGARRRKAAT